MWLLVPEKKVRKTPDKLKQYWKKLKDVFHEKGRLLLSCYLVGMVALFLLFGVLSYVSDILESTYNIFGLTKGFVLAIPVFSMALTSYLSGLFLSDRQPFWKPVIVGGMTVNAITMALLPLFANLIPFMAVLFSQELALVSSYLPSIRSSPALPQVTGGAQSHASMERCGSLV